MTMYMYIGFHLMLTLASVSLHELGTLGTTMSVEWIIGPGLFMYLPPLFEGLLEYGGLSEGLRRIVVGFDSTANMLPGGLIYWFTTLIFFTFQNKTKSAAVRQALRTGTAQYRATGRPNANTRLTLLDTFLQYRAMHYQDACMFLFYYILYRTANMGLAGSLPMATIVFACLCWLTVPTIFAPYHTWENLMEDVTAFYNFMMRCPADRSRAELHQTRMWLNVTASGNKPSVDVPKKGAKGQPGNLFEVLLADALAEDTRFNYRFSDDCISLLSSAVTSVLLLAILPSAALEATEFCFFMWVVHAFLVLTFGVFLEIAWIFVILFAFVMIAAQATSLSTILLSTILFVKILDTVSKTLLFATRRWRKLPGRGRPVTAKNVFVGMKVAPGKDWMYDMKKDDAKQNSASGCSMVGTITNCDDAQELGYCEVLWVNGSEGRYRITTSWQTASDLRRHPDWYAVCVEATVLLFGSYHINLLVAFVVCICHTIVCMVLIAIDSDFLGNWHSRMMRMPTMREMAAASSIGSSTKAGAVGAPPIAMTELGDEIILEDLKREPWAKRELKPKMDPMPPASIIDDPAYRGAQYTEVCRIKLKRVAVKLSVATLRKEYGMVAVAIESRDGLECGLHVPLQTGGSLLFGFEDGVEKWERLREILGLEDPEEDPRDSVERVWLPVYKFEVPQALTGEPWHARSSSMLPEDAKAEGDLTRKGSDSSDEDDDDAYEMDRPLGGRVGPTKSCPPMITPRKKSVKEDSTPRGPAAWRGTSHPKPSKRKSTQAWKPPEMCGIVRHSDRSTKWFPSTDEVLEDGDIMMLSQGSVRSYAMLRAKALFGSHCIGAGFKMVYALTMPRDAVRNQSSGTSHWTGMTPAQTPAQTPTARTPVASEADVLLDTKSTAAGTEGGGWGNSLPSPAPFEFAKLLVLSFMGPSESLAFASTCKATYRASRMPHLWSHAAAYGLVTLDVQQDETTSRAQLLFGFADDVPHEKGLSLFCGFRNKEDLDRCIGSKWLPVFNFSTPASWRDKSVKEVIEEDGLAICGISRRDGTASREIWFPGLSERFENKDEVVMTLRSAKVFAEKYCPTPSTDNIEVFDICKLPIYHSAFLWTWRQNNGNDDPDGNFILDVELELDARPNRHALIAV
eukprot:TRINITY_DN47747_c0_g1_i1.p1 TRINITY_DN47747_c0_g1~~TRINITY_DN47747_c0_g1_i1.p1  ORF type:complete len:1319 (-),score=236.47 TRINITY_DN47747_c0_g1_i1:145-3552(-)